MKKYLILLTVLLLLSVQGCRTTPEKEKIILLPPPEHVEFEPVASVQDMAEVIVKQDAIIKTWEAWGEYVMGVIEDDGATGSN